MAIDLNDINDLTIENFSQWPKALKMAAFLLLFILIVFIAYWFDIKIKLYENQQAMIQITDLKQQYEIKHRRVVRSSLHEKHIMEMKARFKKEFSQFPDEAQVSDLLEKISKLGVESGLKVTLFKPLEEKKRNLYIELPIEMKVVGSYHQVASFINKASKINRVVLFQKIFIRRVALKNNDLTQDENNKKLSVSILLKTYYYGKGDSL
jgi:type IV pilus assembly protein PilO